MTLLGFLAILASVTVTSLAQLSMKVGVEAAKVAAAGPFGDQVWAYALSAYVWLGLVMYGVGAVLWLFVLSRFELSLAYPFVSLSFVMVAALSAVFLGEHLSILRLLGVALIVAGSILVARSA